MAVKVGCCGFPGGMKAYFKEFELVEVQSTFYKLPKLETAMAWRESAPEDFEFAIKAWQAITHPPTSPTYKKAGIKIEPNKMERYGFLRPTEEVFDAWDRSKEIADLLKAKIIVVQCPSSFRCDEENIRRTKEFFGSIDREGIEVAWEPRGDWLENPEIVRGLCDELNLIHVTDPFWDEPVSKHSISYLRLHGLGRRYNYSYRYTDEDLSKLLDKVTKLQGEKEEVYVLFNNVTMRESSLKFMELIGKRAR